MFASIPQIKYWLDKGLNHDFTAHKIVGLGHISCMLVSVDVLHPSQ